MPWQLSEAGSRPPRPQPPPLLSVWARRQRAAAGTAEGRPGASAAGWRTASPATAASTTPPRCCSSATVRAGAACRRRPPGSGGVPASRRGGDGGRRGERQRRERAWLGLPAASLPPRAAQLRSRSSGERREGGRKLHPPFSLPPLYSGKPASRGAAVGNFPCTSFTGIRIDMCAGILCVCLCVCLKGRSASPSDHPPLRVPAARMPTCIYMYIYVCVYIHMGERTYAPLRRAVARSGGDRRPGAVRSGWDRCPSAPRSAPAPQSPPSGALRPSEGQFLGGRCLCGVTVVGLQFFLVFVVCFLVFGFFF